MKNLKSGLKSGLKKILIILCLTSLLGAVVYRLYGLNNLGVVITIILVIIAYFLLQIYNKNPITDNKRSMPKIQIREIVLVTIYCLLLIYCFFTLLTHQATNAVISPWKVVPSYFFAVYALAAITLIIIIFRQKLSNNFLLYLISFYCFLSFSIAWLVYKIGFGFDPFIHQATMELIDKNGAVYPKPFYYLGQYSLIIILHKITLIPVVWLDKLLVPALAALLLPLALFKSLIQWFNNNRAILLLILLLLILPFSFFIVTTPQNFAYLFLLIIIIKGLTCKNNNDLILIYLLALAALTIQPIAGIPALLFALLLTIYYSDKEKIKKYGYIIISILTITVLPLSFYFFENNKTPIGGLGSGEKLINLPKIIIPGQENFIINFVYLYAFNLKFIIILIIVAGLTMFYRNKKRVKMFNLFSLYLLLSLSLSLSYLFTKILPFNFLIEYERSNYADRILIIAAFFLLPFIIIALYSLIDKMLKQNKIINFSFLLFFIILITASLYLSYPRHDRYWNSRGFSIGQADVDAVKWIEQNAESEYIVLANQQVSAAALREFGFKKYYNANPQIFYYPIPTGGPLYQYYLDMVYKKPSRETIIKAMDLANVNEAYFVLNKYWADFPKIAEEAKLAADAYKEFNRGEVFVFEFKK